MSDAPPSDHSVFYSSLVTEHIVSKRNVSAFKQWHHSLIQAAQQQPGFVRSDLCPPLPCRDEVVKWYSIIHFDSPAHLNAWMQSDERRQILAAGQQMFRAYRFKSFTTGLEGWFSRGLSNEQIGLGPPAWKQILSVVLGLYPVVMLQSKLFAGLGISNRLPLAHLMLLNNLITSSILSLAVMPLIVKLMRFWLQPAYRRTSLKTDLWGFIIVAAALAGMVYIFNQA